MADDAIHIETTGLPIETVVERVLAIGGGQDRLRSYPPPPTSTSDRYDAARMTRPRKRLLVADRRGGRAAVGGLRGRAGLLRSRRLRGPRRRHAGAGAFRGRTRGRGRHRRGLTIPWRGGELRARTYTPADITGRPILLVPGVHAAGIAEPRLINFATEIAATGHPVVTAELPDLDAVPDHAAHDRHDRGRGEMARPSGPARPDMKPGLMGISFGGGLVGGRRLAARRAGSDGRCRSAATAICRGPCAICAPACWPTARPARRTTTASSSSCSASPTRWCPPDQVEPLRQGILAFLNASHLYMVDKPRAALEFERARTLSDDPARAGAHVHGLGEQPRRRASRAGAAAPRRVTRRRPRAVARRAIRRRRRRSTCCTAPTTTSSRRRSPRCWPPTSARRGGRVTQLSTPLITHAEVDHAPGAGETWRLIRFWAGRSVVSGLLAQLRELARRQIAELAGPDLARR